MGRSAAARREATGLPPTLEISSHAIARFMRRYENCEWVREDGQNIPHTLRQEKVSEIHRRLTSVSLIPSEYVRVLCPPRRERKTGAYDERPRALTLYWDDGELVYVTRDHTLVSVIAPTEGMREIAEDRGYRFERVISYTHLERVEFFLFRDAEEVLIEEIGALHWRLSSRACSDGCVWHVRYGTSVRYPTRTIPGSYVDPARVLPLPFQANPRQTYAALEGVMRSMMFSNERLLLCGTDREMLEVLSGFPEPVRNAELPEEGIRTGNGYGFVCSSPAQFRVKRTM